MTVGRLLTAVFLSAWMVFTAHVFEEPDLAEQIGDKYRDYQQASETRIPPFSLIDRVTQNTGASDP